MNRKNYLLNLTYQSNISELEKCTPDLVLESNRLQFVGGGLDHVVFSNSNVDDQVVIFKRMSQNSNENEQPNQKFVIDMMETVYETVMNRKFSAINKYRWSKTRMYIYSHTPQQINQFFIKLQNILKQKVQLDEIVIPEIQNLSLDRTYAVVQISKNIFKVGEYNTYVEFKPKSILPDLFSERMIEENSIKFGKTVTEIKQILKKGDPVQKTRWFKKNMLKVKEKQKNDSSHDTKKTKINQNPLHIFNIGPQNKQVPNFIKTKLLKILPSLNDNEEQLLNATIFEQIHSQKQLLQIIHQIQSIYPYSPDFINTQINYNLLDGSKRDKASMCKILQNQIKSIMEQVQIKSLDDMYSNLLNCDCVSQVPKKLHPEGTEEEKQFQNLSNFLLFLISLSWKDISLVYRSKFNGSEFEQAQIWIIDDYLKNFNKVLKNIEKDESLLKKYIKFKLEQNHP